MSLNPQASYSSKARIVLPGYGGQISEDINALLTPTTVSGFTYDMTRARSFAVSLSQSAMGGWGGSLQIEENLDGNWESLGTAISVGTTTTRFETASRGYGKIRINPASLTCSTVDTTLTVTFTAWGAAPGY